MAGGVRRVFLNSTAVRGNETSFEVTDGRRFSETHIFTVYLICGTLLLVTSFGFLYQALREFLKRRRRRRDNVDSPKKEVVLVEYGRLEKIIIILTAVAIMCFVGGEFGIFNFLPAFAVMGPLQLTKAQGVNILAVYFMAYALSRISCFFLTFW